MSKSDVIHLVILQPEKRFHLHCPSLPVHCMQAERKRDFGEGLIKGPLFAPCLELNNLCELIILNVCSTGLIRAARLIRSGVLT